MEDYIYVPRSSENRTNTVLESRHFPCPDGNTRTVTLSGGCWMTWDKHYRNKGLDRAAQARDVWDIAMFFEQRFNDRHFLEDEYIHVSREGLRKVAFKKACHYRIEGCKGIATFLTPDHNPEYEFEKRHFLCPDGITRFVEFDLESWEIWDSHFKPTGMTPAQQIEHCWSDVKEREDDYQAGIMTESAKWYIENEGLLNTAMIHMEKFRPDLTHCSIKLSVAKLD